MQSSLRVWRRISINLIRIAALLGTILIYVVVVVGCPAYLGIITLSLTGWYSFSAVVVFLAFLGAAYFGKSVLMRSDRINRALERFTM